MYWRVPVEEVVEVVEIGDPHVPGWPGQGDQEVLGKYVLRVIRIDEDIGAGGRRVPHEADTLEGPE